MVCLALSVFLAATFLTSPSSKGLELLQNLTESNVITIQSQTITEDMVVKGTTFYMPENQNLHRILPQLQQAKGTPISKPWGVQQNGSTRFIVIFLSSDVWNLGKNHITIEIADDRFFAVEDYWYDADPDWLRSLPQDVGYHSWLTNLRLEDIETVEFIPESGTTVREAERIRLVQFLNRMEIPAIGHPDQLPPLQATYRITTKDGSTQEIFILGSEYLLIGDALYDVGNVMQDLTGAPRDLSQLPLPGDLSAGLLITRDGQPLSLLFVQEELNQLLTLINGSQNLGELSSLDNSSTTLHLYWANGDGLALPLDDSQTEIFRQFGFASLPAELDQREGPVTLPNTLFTEAVVMPAGTAAVSGPEWLEGSRGETSHIYALTSRDGTYWLRLFNGKLTVRTFQNMVALEEQGKTYYILTNSHRNYTNLEDITDQDYVLIS